MPICPHCDHDADSIDAFLYVKHDDGEGHDVDPRISGHSESYLVCPDCDRVLGAAGIRHPY